LSHVDTKLGAAERAVYLAEIKAQLPAFLSSVSTERIEVLADVSVLLNLSASDLNKVVAAHLGLSDEVRELVRDLPQGLRRPITASVSAKIRSQSIRGPVDWADTIRLRAEGGLPSEFVMRTPRRIFDTPENQALGYLLDRLEAELRRVVPARAGESAGVFNGGWLEEISHSAARIRVARKHHWLRGVASQRPSSRVHKRLQAARSRFYRKRLPAGFAVLSKYVESPTPANITELLSRRYFEPQRDWQLFELFIALRLASAFEQRSLGKRRIRMMVGAGRSPYARYLMPDGGEVWLWYQAWPPDAGNSVQLVTLAKHSINTSSSRPDLVAQLRREGGTVDSVILELKASRRAGYLGTGLMQLLGYLRDRPATFAKAPAGWLVAPSSNAFQSAPCDEGELWVVNADAVADALVARFGY
jgi:hypothetical protein